MLMVVLRIALLVAVLMAIHFALDWWLRRERERRLGREHAEGFGGRLSREDYVAQGLAAWERSWGRRLLAAIYVVPALIALGLLLLANYG
jgi:hypothetical protein